MGYYTDNINTTLDELQRRIEDTDLVPSRSTLKEGIDEKFSSLKDMGLDTVESLRRELKNSKNILTLSARTGVDAQYLTLLRREIESIIPKAFPIKDFVWLSEEVIDRLKKSGYKNSENLFTAFECCGIDQIARNTEVNEKVLMELSHIVSLVRIQWISPLVARMLYLTGYTDIGKASSADAEKMCKEMDEINKKYGFFNGKIGLRDIKRIIKAAEYTK